MSNNIEVRKLKVCLHKDDLTKTELTVYECLLEGKSRKIIAEELVVSVNTIQTHCNHIFNKLGVDNQAQLIALEYKRLKKHNEHLERELCILRKLSLSAA